MTFEEIFSKSKSIISKADVSGIDGHLAVEVDIQGEGEGVFYIELKDNKLFVEPYDYHDRDCRFKINAANFIKLAEGKLDPVLAFTTGKLKIDGSVEKALEFKKIIDKIKKK